MKKFIAIYLVQLLTLHSIGVGAVCDEPGCQDSTSLLHQFENQLDSFSSVQTDRYKSAIESETKAYALLDITDSITQRSLKEAETHLKRARQLYFALPPSGPEHEFFIEAIKRCNKSLDIIATRRRREE